MKTIISLALAIGLILCFNSESFSKTEKGAAGNEATAAKKAAAQSKKRAGKKATLPKFQGYKVVSIDKESGTMVIEDKKGDKQEVLLNEKTKYTKSKEKIQCSDVAVGDKVTAYYKQDENGQNVAAKINVWKKQTYKKSAKKARKRAKSKAQDQSPVSKSKDGQYEMEGGIQDGITESSQ
ncbi:MAG: hypothetical protein JW871_01605 [Endomicrobiales bacterium]|nr:hypothetical protein [Endomicrobiales bacterium]